MDGNTFVNIVHSNPSIFCLVKHCNLVLNFKSNFPIVLSLNVIEKYSKNSLMFTLLYVHLFIEQGNSCSFRTDWGVVRPPEEFGFVNNEKESMMIHSIKVIYPTNCPR